MDNTINGSVNLDYSKEETKIVTETEVKTTETNTKKTKQSDEAAVYTKSEKADYSSAIKAMQETLTQGTIDMLKNSVASTLTKQSSGLRGTLSDLLSGKLDLNVTEEDIAKAQEDISADGYWGVEATSDRLVEFAKSISGGDKGKYQTLVDAIKKGYEQAAKAWGDADGGDLPSISQDTYKRTLEKMEDWLNGTEETEDIETVINDK